MAYIRFLNSKKLISCIVLPEKEHVVSLSFSKKTKVNTSGFDLFLDPDGKIDIGGKDYHEFRTVYRNDDVTAEYHGYQLSDDGSIYDPVSEVSEAAEELIEEALVKQKEWQKISFLMREIEDRKRQLRETDYIVLKLYEYALAGKECKEYDPNQVHCKRQMLRDEINDLKQELKNLTREE